MSNAVIHRLRRAGYTVKKRHQWGSKHGDIYGYRLAHKPVHFPVRYMFAHITVTSVDGDAGAREVEEIGVERFGSGMSYNWLVDHETHTIYEGQPLAAKGAHTINDKNVAGFPENLNYYGHAVAFMAMPGDKFCDECEELYAAIQAAERLENVAVDVVGYLPHSKFAWKDCPTDAVRNALPRINELADQMVRDGMVKQARSRGKRRKRHVPRVSLEALQRAAKVDDWARKQPKTVKAVELVVAALEKEGCKTYREWQQKLGYKGKDADGIPGEESLKKLGKKHGFRVSA